MPGVLDDANEDDRREAFENFRRRRDRRGEHNRQRNHRQSHQSRSANDSGQIPGESYQPSQRKAPMKDPHMGGNTPKFSADSSPSPHTRPDPSSSHERPLREVSGARRLAAKVKTLGEDLGDVLKGFLEELSGALNTLATSVWNGLKLAFLFFRIVKCLTPSIIIQAALTAFFSAFFILVGLAVLLNTLIHGFGSTCNTWDSHAPAILTPFPGCGQTAPPTQNQGLSGEDTLDGFTPRISPPFSFLVHSLDNTDEKVSELTDSWFSHPTIWIKDLKGGVSQVESLEKDFAQELEYSWESVNSYIRRFRHADEAPAWWGAIIETMGFSSKAQAKVVEAQNLQLQEILSHSQNRTRAVSASLEVIKSSGIFSKSWVQQMDSFSQQIQEPLGLSHVKESSLHEAYYSFTVSSSSGNYYKSLLEDRGRRLKSDSDWLWAKLQSLKDDHVALRNGPGKMAKNEWATVLSEMQTRILNIAIDWRRRLREHFVESHSG